MVLDLREDVHADSMTCASVSPGACPHVPRGAKVLGCRYEAKPKETTVVLTKEYPHFFDRLVVDEKVCHHAIKLDADHAAWPDGPS